MLIQFSKVDWGDKKIGVGIRKVAIILLFP